MAQLGNFYGIGVGPGASDLLTLRAVNILKTVEVVCIPRSSSEKDSVALQAAGIHVPASAKVMELSTPMTRDVDVLEQEWKKGAEIIANYLANGKNVAFLTIGDSMLFSTYTYFLKKVRHIVPNVQIESVPGITSFSAAAAFLNSALAEGTEKLAIIPAIEDTAELPAILQQFSNVVLMKIAGKYNEIVDILDSMKLKTKAVYISKLGYPDQFVTYDLDSMRNMKRDYLSLILVKREGF